MGPLFVSLRVCRLGGRNQILDIALGLVVLKGWQKLSGRLDDIPVVGSKDATAGAKQDTRENWILDD